MKGPVSWFASNHVAANILMVFLMAAGVFTAMNAKVEVFPETAMDRVNITVVYPGASPEEVEESIVKRIEENIAGLPGIKKIESLANEGAAVVGVEVITGWDVKELTDDIKTRVDRITTFPVEAERPVVARAVIQSQVISVAIFGDAPESTLKHLTEKAQDEITAIDGISQVTISGIRTSEIHIEIDEQTLLRYGLTLGQAAQKIAQAGFDLPAGSVKTQQGEVLIRTKGRMENARDYAGVAILTRPDGTKVTLGQIAGLKEGFEDSRITATFQGKPATFINVFRVGDQSALKVAAAVKDYIEKARPRLPAGVSMRYYSDLSASLKSRISLLMRNMAFGLVLVVIMLGMFMDVRLSVWVTLGIPISFLTGLIFLPYMDVSINMISLFAFIMVLGIVVDDAIVIGENVYRRQQEGMPRLEGAIAGALEVGRPVVFSVLTTVVAFWPLLMGQGMMGKIMRNIPIVVILVLLASLAESLFILPSHLAMGKGNAGKKPKREKISARALAWFIRRPYGALLKFCVRWRYATLAVAIAAMLLSLGVHQAGWIQFTFFPKVEGDLMQCMVTMPNGTLEERTLEVVRHLEKTAMDMLAREDAKRPPGSKPLMEYHGAIAGAQFGMRGTSSGGEHLGQIWIQLLPGEERGEEFSSARLTQAWREAAGEIPDAEDISFSATLHSAGNPIEFHLSSNDSRELEQASAELKAELARIPGVFDIGDSYDAGKKEIQLKLKPAARTLGLTLDDLARQVRNAFYGAEALRMQRGRDEIKVRVRFPENERKSLGDMENMRIRTPKGDFVPFSLVAQVDMKTGYASIIRSQRMRVIQVTADLDQAVANAGAIRADLEKNFIPDMLSRYPGLSYSVEGEGKEQMESLQDVIMGFGIALFAIYALLAIPFKSFTQPAVVMAVIPFGMVGAMAGHLIMGMDLSILSLFGMVGAAGVVVNDSLVLVHAANRMRRDGLHAFDAVTSAASLRFRAILLTSLTTFAGLTPMIMEKSLQARFLVPMAISLGYGVLFSTGITLLLIPCGYVILDDIHRFFTWLFKGTPEEEAPPPLDDDELEAEKMLGGLKKSPL